MEQNDEKTPLLTDQKAEAQKAEEGQNAEIEEEEVPLLRMLIDPYEPVTKHTHSKLPSSLMLLGLCGGMAAIEILGIFGAYLFLVSHAHTIFPMCTQADIIDRWIGANPPNSYLCVGSGWMLWTFPLFCVGVIPFTQYWEFCDQRLFYECLREKVLVKFREKRFFSAPLIIIMIVWFLLGMTTLLFGGNPGKDREAWLKMTMAILPFLLPVISFAVTLFIAWDIKFFLITLSNYADEDVYWAQRHLAMCISATDEDVMEAFERLQDAGELPVGGRSELIFSAIKDELCKPESSPSQNAVDSDTLKWIYVSMDRMKALIFFRDGFWLTDLLWMPQDNRAKMFRIMYRLFTLMVWTTLAFSIYMVVLTTILYMEQQGRIEARDVPSSVMWLRNFIIATA